MAPQGDSEDFKVVDRRRFTAEGEAAPSAKPAPEPQPAPEPGVAAGEEAARPPGPGRAAADLPPASFPALVQMLAMSALDALGVIPGPDGKAQPPDLALARHGIDLLGLLEAKTRGNLSPDEARLLEQTLFDLRMLAVRAAGGRS
jgi:hypothetical protein